MHAKLDENSAKLLCSMQAQENKLKRKIQQIDSSKAQELFTDDVSQRYADLQIKLGATSEKLNQFPLKDYIPGLDSVQTSLAFFIQNSNLPQNQLEQLRSLSAQVQNLGAALQKANDIQAFVREREAMLREKLMNSGVGKQLLNMNKQVYYYQARIAEYKELLNDKEKLKEKLLVTIRTLPAFQAFWRKYSYLAALFPAPDRIPRRPARRRRRARGPARPGRRARRRPPRGRRARLRPAGRHRRRRRRGRRARARASRPARAALPGARPLIRQA